MKAKSAILQRSTTPERIVIAAGAVIGLCIVGDSFLYSILPLEAQNLGIALPLVGVLLSVNRLVRLISNTWASAVFERLGPRTPFVLAAALSLITTATYGVGWGFLAFLLARLGWGIAWSALRQGGYQAVWTGDESVRGRLMGLLWGLIRLGSAFSVVVGGYLRDRWGYPVGIAAIVGASALAIPVALAIRWPGDARWVALREPTAHDRRSLWEGWRSAWATGPRRGLLFAGFMDRVFDGVVISTTSLFLAGRLGTNELLSGLGVRVATVAGFLLALRWTSDLVFGPAIGALSDRLGRLRTLVVLVAAVLIGLVGVVSLSGVWLIVCLALMFVSGSGLGITLNTAANSAALQAERPYLFVGVYTTAGDAGSALGPLLAYSLAVALNWNTLYLLTGGVLTLAVLLYRRLALCRAVRTSG